MRKQRQELPAMVLAALGESFPLTKLDLGADAQLKKNGFTFDVDAYDAEGLGHICFLCMKAMGGLMKMETAVLATTEKDLPMMNLDWVKAPGTETQMAELYDTQLAAYPAEAAAKFQAIKDRDADLTDRETDPHWYDDILLPCSYDKTGKKITERLSKAAEAYLQEYIAQVKAAPDCDAAAKKAKVKDFAETLFAQGGPAVDQVTKLFGRETAARLILGHMYGVQ
ncbi:MAG: hypothetical protein IKX83_01940 [Clostridia bacterium]|nr:hypothetical protein [Clostridia bacterium]